MISLPSSVRCICRDEKDLRCAMNISPAFPFLKSPDKERSNEVLLLFGHGDGGGGPLPEMIERLERMRDIDGLPKVPSLSVVARSLYSRCDCRSKWHLRRNSSISARLMSRIRLLGSVNWYSLSVLFFFFFPSFV